MRLEDDRYTRLADDVELRRAFCNACGIPSLEHYRSIDSTQRRAREVAGSVGSEWWTIAADHQTAGRGQHGRTWASADGASVLVSMVVAPRSAEALALVPIRTGLIIAAALEELLAPNSRIRIDLKWPNDLKVGDAKLGGILCEAQTRGDELRAVVGIGINVRSNAHDTDANVDAVALDDIGDEPLDRFDVLRSVVSSMRNGLDISSGALSQGELGAYRQRDWLLGRAITSPAVGAVEGINEHGHLFVRTADGTVSEIVSGSVSLASA